ncbi:MAG: zinc ribbon domain-containing protein [Methanobacterium sp.]|uniref:zinc ribbon domain-containing protein n=1 Tax=Methanobacterium sp. TaxID=2164 RepID=UPI003D662D04|nr:zinc ribbon domain-containing protein [Methanobacterium sp.]
MKYLICEKCGGYYKLQEGESLGDFYGCDCGGDYREAKEYEIEDLENSKLDTKENSKLDTKEITNKHMSAEDIRKKLEEKRNELDICRHCGYKNIEEAEFCIKCGAKIGANICPKCEIENPKDAEFCYKCGHDLKNKPQSTEIISKKGLGIGMGIIIFLFSPLAGIIGYIVWHDSKPKKAEQSGLLALAGFILWFITYLLLLI